MIIQMMKQKNPEHEFYIPYLQPIKAKIEQAVRKGEIKKVELESFILPKEAVIYISADGIENIYVDGKIVDVMTEIPSGIVYLINNETNLKVDKYILIKDNVTQFPNINKKAV